MSMDKHPNFASQQLQLFGCDVSVEQRLAPTTAGECLSGSRPGLYLVASAQPVRTPQAQHATEHMTSIEARLIGRTKLF